MRKSIIPLLIPCIISGCSARADTEILLGAIRNLDAKISVTNTTVSNYDKWAMRFSELTDLLSAVGKYWVYILIVVLVIAPIITYVTGKAVWILGRNISSTMHKRKDSDNG